MKLTFQEPTLARHDPEEACRVQVPTFASAELFLESGAISETECLIVDIQMPGIDGLELQRQLNVSQADVPIIFLTGHDEARNRRLAMERGAIDFMRPFDASALVAAIRTATARHVVQRWSPGFSKET